MRESSLATCENSLAGCGTCRGRAAALHHLQFQAYRAGDCQELAGTDCPVLTSGADPGDRSPAWRRCHFNTYPTRPAANQYGQWANQRILSHRNDLQRVRYEIRCLLDLNSDI